jgi:ppGpp synthetase/RelA/SpoT-type nucleotidyltranferase
MDAAILGEYDGLRGRYDAFRKYLESLLPQLIAAEKIQPHKIESRLKSRQSLEEKIGRPGKSYSQLADITDICGARIITYFAADVDAVASLLEREFAIYKAHSIDRRQDLDPNRFGYASLHYVISLSSERAKLTECASWKGYKAEVQVRTIIQHAWAEIEHDLGFKSSTAVPREIKRRFARLSALLEMADDEFAGIKKDLAGYTERVSAELTKYAPDVEINGPSVSELLKSDPTLQACERAIATRSSREIRPSADEVFSLLASELHFVGIKTVAELHRILDANQTKIVNVAVDRLSKAQGAIGSGITILYTCYAALAEKGDIDEFVRFLDSHGFGPREDFRTFAAKMIESFRTTAS